MHERVAVFPESRNEVERVTGTNRAESTAAAPL